MAEIKRRKTVAVRVGSVVVGGGAPVVVQSMTNTDTADAASTARQIIDLARAGSELVRITVNVPEAAKAVPEIRLRVRDAGVTAPLIGDFHYNGHQLLTEYPDCARSLDKYRINPGNVGAGADVAGIDPVLVQRPRAVRILGQELVPVVMEIADEGRGDPGVPHAQADLGDRFRSLRHVHRDPNQLGSGARQVDDLPGGRRGVGGVGVCHRLDNHRRAASHHNRPDPDSNRFSAFDLSHLP